MAADRIDAYLDDLLPRLHGPAADIRSTLAEAEAHLRDAADAEIAHGAVPDEAQQRAIASFGSPREVSAAANRGVLGISATQLTAALLGPAARMVAVALAAVAVSALAARALAAVTSKQFVFGPPDGTSFSAEQCRHYLDVQSSAATCARAATLESADDATFLHLGAAVLGLALLGAVYLVMRRIRPAGGAPHGAVPAGIAPAVGAAVFGTVAVALVVAGFSDAVVSGLWGRGLWYVEGCVALLVAAAYAIGFGRALLTASG